MVSSLRSAFNNGFSEEKYQGYLKAMNEAFNYEIEFRIAESPIFVPASLKKKIFKACDDIISVLKRGDFREITQRAVPLKNAVPDETPHSHFLALDFAICKDTLGDLEPQLIELQGFPSLFAFQHFISETGRQFFDIPENYHHLFNDLDEEGYINELKKVLLNGHNPENVILLEIDPEKQKTKIDFYCTEKYTGVKPVCISEIIKEDRKLFYMRDGVKTPIYRIYNRVIFDELESKPEYIKQWNLTDPVDVEWAGHPNWFFRISKYTLPFIKSKYVPESFFLDKLETYPTDLENYVLKPLYSFAGQGVKINVTADDLIAIEDRSNWILMKKVHYAPAVETPDGGSKVEIRMLFLWPDDANNPKLVTSLVRLSKGEMIGVRYNKDKNWVGASMAYFEQEV